MVARFTKASLSLTLLPIVTVLALFVSTQAAQAQNACTTSDTYEYTWTSAHNGNFYSVAVGSQSGLAVTCINTPPVGGWTLADSECIASDVTVGCKSMVCQWKRPTTHSVEYAITHEGAQFNFNNVNCEATTKPGYTLTSKVCVVPSTSGGCASDICFWQKVSASPTTVSLNHYGSSAALREPADCRNSSNADRVERQCLISAEVCLSDICLLSNTPTSTATYEYQMTFASTFYYAPNGQSSGSVTSCQNTAPSGGDWTLAKATCLISGAGCYSESCLWKRSAPPIFQYTMTHAGGNYTDSLSCALQPPAGYTLKSRGCIANNSVGPHFCASDECFWVKTGSPGQELTITHHGSNGTPVDCRTQPPAGYTLNSQTCLYSGGPCLSDQCLWQRIAQCQVLPQCRDGIDNDSDGRIDFPNDLGCATADDNDETNTAALPQCSDGVDNADPEDTLADFNDPGCYTNGIYNPNDNNETNVIVTVTLPACSDGLDNDGDGKADFFDPGCYPNNVFNPAQYNPNDNDESNPAILCRWSRVNSQWVRACS